MSPRNIFVEFLKACGTLQNKDFTGEDVEAAFESLNADTGLDVLEKMIESPITPEWGSIILRLHPEWRHLDRWMRLSKLHCLAAIDALVALSESRELPRGADPPAIHAALDFALEQWGNPRLKDAAKKIRYRWPSGPRPKNEFTVSEPLSRAAELLFRQNEKFNKGWLRSATYAMDAPKDQQELWRLLLEYAEKQKLVFACDWNESASEINHGLRRLYFVKELKIDWPLPAQDEGDDETAAWLYSTGAALCRAGEALVSLDHDFGDCYFLAVMPAQSVAEVTACLGSLNIRVIDLAVPEELQATTPRRAEFDLSSDLASDGQPQRTTLFSTFWNAVLKTLGIHR